MIEFFRRREHAYLAHQSTPQPDMLGNRDSHDKVCRLNLEYTDIVTNSLLLVLCYTFRNPRYVSDLLNEESAQTEIY